MILPGFVRRESFEERNPYLFVSLVTLFFLGINVSVGSLTGGLLGLPVLGIIAVVFLTRRHSWKSVGFTTSGLTRRSILLFVPIFIPILWWLFIAPMIGYGTLQFSGIGNFSIILGFTLLIGFVEEVYFRGVMLQALKTRGLWTATIVTSLLFGLGHATNALASSPLYTLLQVGYAVPLGLSFAAVVLITKLLWPVVLSHGLINFGAYLNSAAGGGTSTTVTQMDYFLTAFLIVVFTTYAVVLLQNDRGARFLSRSKPAKQTEILTAAPLSAR